MTRAGRPRRYPVSWSRKEIRPWQRLIGPSVRPLRASLAKSHRRGGSSPWVGHSPDGELLDAAEAAEFDGFVTTDRNLRYQQNLTGRRIAIVVFGKARWRLIKPRLGAVVEAVDAALREVSSRWTFQPSEVALPIALCAVGRAMESYLR